MPKSKKKTPQAPPGEPVIISYSELDTYRQCPLKHHLTYVERWTQPKEATSALAKGTYWHNVLEAHYGAIKAYRKRYPAKPERLVLAYAQKAGLAAIAEGAKNSTEEVTALIGWMYDGYIENYGADENWRILGVETKVVVPLHDLDGQPTRYHIKAKMDLVVFDLETATLEIVDHKSGANLPSQMDLEIDDQFGLYTVALRRLGHNVSGSIHSAARTTRNMGDYLDEEGNPPKGKKAQTLDERMRRTYLHRGDHEVRSIELDALAVAKHARPLPEYVKNPLPVYSSPDPRQCGWKCDVKEPHLAMRGGGDPHEILEGFGFVQDFTRH